MIATKTIPAVGYVRMSSDRQEASPIQQRDEIEKLAKAEGFHIVRWYDDHGISGDDTEKREGFKRMIADASGRGDFSAILCWDQDRFGRFDSLEAGEWICPLRDAGVSLVTVAQGTIDWTNFGGRVQYMVQQEGKHEYLRDLARNVARGQRTARLTGKWSGPAPYGYEIGVDGFLTPGDPERVAAVRLIFELRSKGHGYTAISRALNERAIPAPRGGLWAAHSLRHILLRETYRGVVVIGKFSRAKYQRITDEPIRLEDKHPPLVDPKVWLACQRLNHKGQERGESEGTPLAGFYRVVRYDQTGSSLGRKDVRVVESLRFQAGDHQRESSEAAQGTTGPVPSGENQSEQGAGAVSD